jgi:hypothetical protein
MTELDAIRERMKAATPGPWEARPYVDLDYYAELGMYMVVPDLLVDESEAFTKENAIFIAHSREDIEKLLAVAEVAAAEPIVSSKWADYVKWMVQLREALAPLLEEKKDALS